LFVPVGGILHLRSGLQLWVLCDTVDSGEGIGVEYSGFGVDSDVEGVCCVALYFCDSDI
jgi:hypothetical protein